MSGSPRWAGPYCAALSPTGARLAWDPLTDRRPPRQAVKFVVRWRVQGFPHPRKATFTEPLAAATWARRSEAARLLGLPCDSSGRPVHAAPAATAAPAAAVALERGPAV